MPGFLLASDWTECVREASGGAAQTVCPQHPGTMCQRVWPGFSGPFFLHRKSVCLSLSLHPSLPSSSLSSYPSPLPSLSLLVCVSRVWVSLHCGLCTLKVPRNAGIWAWGWGFGAVNPSLGRVGSRVTTSPARAQVLSDFAKFRNCGLAQLCSPEVWSGGKGPGVGHDGIRGSAGPGGAQLPRPQALDSFPRALEPVCGAVIPRGRKRAGVSACSRGHSGFPLGQYPLRQSGGFAG